MIDLIVKPKQIYWVNEIDEEDIEKQVPKSLDDMLPPDRVITIDGNGYVYLYDTCIVITEDMIERVL